MVDRAGGGASLGCLSRPYAAPARSERLEPDAPVAVSFRDRAAREERTIPRGDKSKYTDKQKRQADHIADGYAIRGVPEEEAERRAWATVNKESGGGKKSGSGRGKAETRAQAKKGGGRAPVARPAAARSASAKKAAATRKRNAAK